MCRDPAKPYLDNLQRLFADYLAQHPGVDLYLFGSRARGEAGRYSDIDVGLLSAKPLAPNLVSDLKAIAAKSHIPYEVDVVDLASVNEAFKTSAMKGAILWKQG